MRYRRNRRMKRQKTVDCNQTTVADFPRWWLNIRVQGQATRSLLDSGSARSIMGPKAIDLAREKGVKLRDYIGSGVRVANGNFAPIFSVATFDFTLGNVTKSLEVLIMPNLSTECILGADFMRLFNVVLHPRDSKITAEGIPQETPVELASVSVEDVDSRGLSQLTPEQTTQLNSLLDKLLPADPDELGCTNIAEHVIDVGGAQPIRQRCYPVSRKIEEEMHRQVDDLLKRGIITCSSSEWGSPVVMIKKTTTDELGNPVTKYRMCIDYRKVNKVSKGDAFPIPNLEQILNKLGEARHISTLDLSRAYNQIPLAPESRHISAFLVPGKGIFEWTRMPFGLKGATATFQRAMTKIITPEMAPNAFVYVDDIIIATSSWEQHLHWLEVIITRLTKAGFTINRKKSFFARKEVRFLGFIVDSNGTRPDPDKIKPVIDYPVPKTAKQVLKFLGMSGWYRKWIPGYGTIADPLINLTRKNVNFVWDEKCQESFETLKLKLTSAPILCRPVANLTFILETDASNTGLGCVLLQRDEDKRDRVIAYASRVLSDSERKFSVTERETLAILWGIRKFRCYIEGDFFKVISDHNSLLWLFNLQNPSGRLARWALELQQYDFTVEHRVGAEHRVPDCLSRIYEDEEVEAAAAEIDDSIKDPWYLQRLKDVIARPKEYRNWKVVNGLLYYYRPDPRLAAITDEENDWKLVIPREERKRVLEECHNDVKSGHLGQKKSYYRASTLYYWPSLYKDMVRYVRSCYTCQQCKPMTGRPLGYMEKREVSQPFKQICSDCVGPFPRSKNGHQFVVIFEDIFTKWIEAVPIRKKDAETIVKHFKERILFRHGTPDRLISDNGVEYVNKLMKNLATERNFVHLTVPPGFPQAEPCERVNKTFKSMIIAYMTEDHRSWDLDIQEKAWCYNTSIHEAVGFSPFYLCHGRHPVISPTLRLSKEQAAAQKWEEKLRNIELVRQIARDNQRESTETQAKYYNLRHTPHNFKVGDKVLIKNVVLSNAADHTAAGLAPKFRGTYVIIEKISENTYKVADETGNVIGDFNVQQMKPRVEADETESEIDLEDDPEPAQLPTQPEPAKQASPETASKPRRGRPPKKKQGPPRKTILAPQASSSKTKKAQATHSVSVQPAASVSPELTPFTPRLGKGESPEKPVLLPKAVKRMRAKSV